MEIMAFGIHLGTVLLCLLVQAEHIGCSWNQASESVSKGRGIYRYAGLSQQQGAGARVGDNGGHGDGGLAQNQFRAASIVSAPGRAQREGSGSIHRGDAATGGSIHRGDAATGGSIHRGDAATGGSIYRGDAATGGSIYRGDAATGGSIHRGDAATGGSIHRGDAATGGSIHRGSAAKLRPHKAKGHHWKRFGFGLSTDIGSGAKTRGAKLQRRNGFTPLKPYGKGICNLITRERSAHASEGLASSSSQLFQASHQPPAQEKTKAVHPALIRTGPPANSGRKPAGLFQGDFSTDVRRPPPSTSSVADVKVAPRSFREQSVNAAPRSFPGERITSGEDDTVSWGTSSVKVAGQRVPSQQGSSQMSQTMSASGLYPVPPIRRLASGLYPVPQIRRLASGLYPVPPIRRLAAQRALKAEEYTVSSGQINFVRSADLLPPRRGPAQHGPSTGVHNVPKNLGGVAIRRASENKPQPTRPAATQGPPPPRRDHPNSDWMTVWPRPVTEARDAGMPQPTRALYINPPTPPPPEPTRRAWVTGQNLNRPPQNSERMKLWLETQARGTDWPQVTRTRYMTTPTPPPSRPIPSRPRPQQQSLKWFTTARPQEQQGPKWFTIQRPFGATFP